MSKKEDEAFKAYLDGLKSKLPAEKHAHLDALIDEDAFRDGTYRAGLRQDEFHRKLNDLKKEQEAFESQKSQYASWYQEQLPKNELLQREKDALEMKLRATLAAAGLSDQNEEVSPMKGDVNKDIEQLRDKLSQAEQALIGMNAALPHFLKDTLKVQHLIHKGQYDIDPGTVIDYSMQNKVTPEAAFEVLRKEEDAKRLEKSISDREAVAREAGRREALSSRPTPDYAGRASANPVISHLQGKEDLSDQRTRVRGAADMLRGILSGGGS